MSAWSLLKSDEQTLVRAVNGPFSAISGHTKAASLQRADTSLMNSDREALSQMQHQRRVIC